MTCARGCLKYLLVHLSFYLPFKIPNQNFIPLANSEVNKSDQIRISAQSFLSSLTVNWDGKNVFTFQLLIPRSISAQHRKISLTWLLDQFYIEFSACLIDKLANLVVIQNNAKHAQWSFSQTQCNTRMPALPTF